MKRLPLIVTVLAVVLLSASLAYWGLQLFKPQQRAIAAPPPPPPMGVNLDAAKGLFGGQVNVAAVSNYQLKGVVAARGEDSAAIISVDNKPAVALAVGKEVMPGVVVKEVHARHVILSEGGVIKRVDLPSDAGVSSGPATLPGQLGPMPASMPPPVVQPVVQPAPPPVTATPSPSFQQTPGQPPVMPQQNAQTAPQRVPPIPSNDRQ
ncbi:general secretion pathway protein C [Duganella sp. CF402]|uniref:type II secretion system protein N n=1 Tax=unclassified Duganella TaxID=2636909 RepID=UPI0008AB2A30|nr:MULTISPECIES: type II secretion system protein N [unclassified Duganella]RZT05865.1 general secretion pathway protein C [Duganella sp. BK701]SEM81786.1 general secretion pathway protein C [Duganella sp. CF402]